MFAVSFMRVRVHLFVSRIFVALDAVVHSVRMTGLGV